MLLMVLPVATTYGWHMPLEQVPPLHEWPQTPQLAASVCRLLQVSPLQIVYPLLQTKPQEPPVQFSVPLAGGAGHATQLTPPVPQLETDGVVSQVPAVPPWQQPLGQSVPSQVHAPVVVSHMEFGHWAFDEHGTHTPPAHAGVAPGHATADPHEPFAWHVSMKLIGTHCVAPGEHVTHVPLRHTGVPPLHAPQLSIPPQPSLALPHVTPSAWQVVGTHTHAPFWHTGLPVPVHDVQVLPPFPHDEFDSLLSVSHVPLAPPLQQPLGQVCESQLHEPLVVSHSAFPQPVQVAPAVPHEAGPSDAHASQPAALQQPCGHEVESQTHVPGVAPDLLHSRPLPHPPQLTPPVPQEPLLSAAYSSHVPVVPPLQQPRAHEVASQTHWPVAVLHSLPDGQAPHEAPPAPHDPLFSLESASQDVPLQQPAHAPPPHVHTPLEQLCPLPHGPQLAPPVPHELLPCPAYASQIPPAVQQPLGHEAALQTH